MNKYFYVFVFIMFLFIISPSYAECDHQYIREYNYSTEVFSNVNEHIYRLKCSLCNQIVSTSEIMYEKCKYNNGKCILCKGEEPVIPECKIKINEKLLNYVYHNCQKYDIINSYKILVALIYKQSEFNVNLENGAYKGLFQLNSAYDYSWLIGRENYNIMNPYDNIDIGVALFNYYYRLNDNKNPWIGVITFCSGYASADMKEYKSSTDIIANVKLLNEISKLLNDKLF